MWKRYLALGAALVSLSVSGTGCPWNRDSDNNSLLHRVYQAADANKDNVLEITELGGLLKDLGYTGTLEGWRTYNVTIGDGSEVRLENVKDKPELTIILPRSRINGYIAKKSQPQQ